MAFFSRRYRLNHCRQVLQNGYRDYLKKKDDPLLKSKLLALDGAIQGNDKVKADSLTRGLEDYLNLHYKKSWFKSGAELVLALAVALIVATIIRAMWFELYEIPTGSMRPTFKEQDHLTVSKAQFGINIPLETEHFLFDPNLVQRTSAIIFSGDKIPVIDSYSPFLGVFPYKKRYVKRLIAKPLDSVYFYGGKLYAQDKDNAPLDEFLTAPWMEKLDYIPFISFEGQPKNQGRQSILFSYYNIPLGKVTMTSFGALQGEIFNGKEWVSDDLKSAKGPHDQIKTLGDFFGMQNFAMAQIYTKEELAQDRLKAPSEGILYLVLRHTPHLDFSVGEKQATHFPKVMTSVVPLQEEDLKTLMDSMYTARFVVEKGKVKRYSLEGQPFASNAPEMTGIPDGTYEFYYGKAYEVHFGGIATELPSTHPLYAVNPKRVQQLFNLGTNWDKSFEPGKAKRGYPTRYAYFREGDLYTLGMPLLKKDNPKLKAFLEDEGKKQANAKENDPYIAFIDRGAPKSDPQFFKTFGLQVPEKQYLVLGDNHAMSGDSRVFGFVPEENLQGVPEVILWPPLDRLGPPSQKPYPTVTKPRLIVWAIAAVVGSICWVIHRRRLRRPLTDL